MRMGRWHRVMRAVADVKVPMRSRLVPVYVRVTIHATGGNAPETDGSEDDEEHAAQHLAASLDDDRKRPSERHERAGSEGEEEGMANGKANGHPQRPRALHGRRFTRRSHRQRRDGHQVIGAEPMEKTESECERNEEHYRKWYQNWGLGIL